MAPICERAWVGCSFCCVYVYLFATWLCTYERCATTNPESFYSLALIFWLVLVPRFIRSLPQSQHNRSRGTHRSKHHTNYTQNQSQTLLREQNHNLAAVRFRRSRLDCQLITNHSVPALTVVSALPAFTLSLGRTAYANSVISVGYVTIPTENTLHESTFH